MHDPSRMFQAVDASDQFSDLDDQTDAKKTHKYQSKKSSHSKEKTSVYGKKAKKKMEVAWSLLTNAPKPRHREGEIGSTGVRICQVS